MSGAGRIELEASDETVRKYEMLGKLIQENAEGLAALEEEIPAEKAREDKSLKSNTENDYNSDAQGETR